jgi:hypothetical protein
MEPWMWSAALVPIGLWLLNAAVDALIRAARRMPESRLKAALLFGDDGRCRGDGQQPERRSLFKPKQRIARLPGPKT